MYWNEAAGDRCDRIPILERFGAHRNPAVVAIVGESGPEKTSEINTVVIPHDVM